MPDFRDHRSYDELFIGGRWRKPANRQRLTVISPHSEEPVGACPRRLRGGRRRRRRRRPAGVRPRPVAPDGPAERMRKVEAARRRSTPATLDEMADLITAEMGSPRSFSRLGQAAGGGVA